MNLRWLEAFHTVARNGGFTAAARALNVSQSTISTHVRALEDRFRVELFHRRGRTVLLTEIGSQLFTITQGMFGHKGEAANLLSAARALEVGSLKVGSIRPSDVMEIAAPMLKQHAHLKLMVTVGSGPDLLDGLLKFDFDVVIVGDDPNDQRFFSQFYNKHRIVIAANVNHPLAQRRSIKIEELEGENFILRTSGSTTRKIFDRALQKAGVTVHAIMETNNREAINTAVIKDIGLGAISESEIIAHPKLKILTLKNVELYNAAHVVCLTERRKRPLIDGFFKVVSKTRPR